MTFLALDEPGAQATILVQRVSRGKSKFGQDYNLTGPVDGGAVQTIAVPEKAMERQMQNTLKVDKIERCVGKYLLVSRSDSPGGNGKLYWNVTYANADDVPVDQPAPAAAPSPKSVIRPPAPVAAATPEVRKQERARLNRFRHMMFEDEARFQLQLSAKLAKEFPDQGRCAVTFETVHAACATDLAVFDGRGLL